MQPVHWVYPGQWHQKHLSDLESEFGLQLLNRTTRSLTLTEAGRIQYDRCVEILRHVDDAYHQAGNMQNEPAGVLRVNAPISFGYLHLAPAIVAFQRQHPRITVELTLNDRFVNLVDEGFDLAVRIGKLRDSDLMCRRLATCNMVLCATNDYLKRNGNPLAPESLKDHNCLIYSYFSQGAKWQVTDGEKTKTITVNGTFKSNSGEAVLAATLKHGGIALLPDFLVGQHLENGELLIVLERFDLRSLDIHAVYPRDRFATKKMKHFIEFLQKFIGNTPIGFIPNAPKYDRYVPIFPCQLRG